MYSEHYIDGKNKNRFKSVTWKRRSGHAILHAVPRELTCRKLARALKESLEKLVAGLIAKGQFEPPDDPKTPRGRIARAALELFAARSYEGTTTKEIARRARTTERTLFKHFGSKEKLFAQTVFPAFLRALTPVVQDPEVRELLSGEDDFRSTLRALLVNRIAVATRHPTLFIMMWRELLARPAFRAAHAKVFARRGQPVLDAFIARGRERGELQGVPTDVIYRTIWGQLISYLVTRLVLAPERAWDTEADAEQILDIIMNGIGAGR